MSHATRSGWLANRLANWPLGACLASIAAMVGVSSATAQDGETVYSCAADAAARELGSDVRETELARTEAPEAEGQTSQRLFELSILAEAAYTMYFADVEADDPLSAVDLPGYEIVDLIYGDPSRQSEPRRERGRQPLDSEPTFYGFIALDEATQERFVTFRGTLEPAEWARNVQLRQSKFPQGGQVHTGFYKIFQSLRIGPEGSRGELIDHLASGAASASKTTFIGHSLGGAVATIAAIDASDEAWAEGGQAVELATFASPRPGDPAFATLADKIPNKTRVCNLVDLVPSVPFTAARTVYTHVGDLVALSSFDFEEQLDNATESYGEQIVCWHDMAAYGFMLDPEHAVRPENGCFVPVEED